MQENKLGIDENQISSKDGERDLLLATDLDGTLVGDDRATQRLNEIIITIKQGRGLKLAYVTGRSPELFSDLQKERSLMAPDALVTSMGTEIYVDGEKLKEWPRVSNWNLRVVKDLLSQYPSLCLQPATEQRDFKLSYFLKSGEQLIDEIRSKLKNYPVDVVYSMGLYLDILPNGVNKGSALLFLAEKWGIDSGDIYACGDSGNDIDMLAVSNAIIVGNAKGELLRWAENQSGGIYKAESNYADGIIEGLKHYRILG